MSGVSDKKPECQVQTKRIIQKHLVVKNKLQQLKNDILDSFPVATVTMDLDLNITSFNKKAEELTGWSASRAIGSPCYQILQSSRCSAGDCPLHFVPGAREKTGLEAEIINQYGEHIPVRIGSAPLENEHGELVGHFEIIEDISKEKELEREKMNFQFMVIHDMKSPLIAMLGLAKRLQEHHGEMNDEKLEKYLLSIQAAGEQLEEQVVEFLEFCRQATGRLKLHFVETSIPDILEQLIERHSQRAAEKNISLTIKHGTSVRITGDPHHLQRVFENLLDNAIKFSNPGNKITLKTKEKAREIIIQVKDNGPGIAAEELPYIFDAFHRAKSTEDSSGHGLGLSAVKAIVRGHRGRVSVESKPGKGSVFTVRLPKGQKA